MPAESRKWWQDDKGNVSSLRIIVVPSAIIGQIVVLVSLGALLFGIPEAVAAMGIGAAMIATAEGAKSWQKNAESKN